MGLYDIGGRIYETDTFEQALAQARLGGVEVEQTEGDIATLVARAVWRGEVPMDTEYRPGRDYDPVSLGWWSYHGNRVLVTGADAGTVVYDFNGTIARVSLVAWEGGSPVKVEEVSMQDPYGIYGEAPARMTPPISPRGGFLPIPVGGGVAAISLRGLLPRLGPVGTMLWNWVRQQARGAIVRWSALPSWLKQILILIGVTEGADLLIDTGEEDRGLVPIPIGGGGGGELVGMQNDPIVRHWTANGVSMVRFASGKMGAQRKNGSWTIWRPKRPIVLYPGGAGNLRTMLRADKVLNTQAKQLRRVLDRRAPRPARRQPATKAAQITPGTIIKVE